MKLKNILIGIGAALLTASAASASNIATWTFETSLPAGAPGAGVWLTNLTAEVGTGTAAGLHAGASTYSNPAGNGSAHSFSSTAWAVGDFYQFAVSTLGAQSIQITYDQTASGTGPGQFYLAYSTDGVNFTVADARTNTIAVNASPNPTWSATGTRSPIYTTNYDLSAITAINNQSVVYFRVVCASTVSANGGTVASGGTCRIDNFEVDGSTGTPPLITGITPPGLTTNAGNDVTFTVNLSQGDTPLFYQWFASASDNTLTPLVGATNASLLLPAVLEANATNYVVVVTNNAPTGNIVTSAPVTLTVIDPAFNVEPASQTNLPNSTAQFSALAAGTAISYQWYFCADPNDASQISGPVTDTTLPSGAIANGSQTGTLTLTNVTAATQTNFALVVTGTFGSVTSSVVSLTIGTTAVPLAFWTFNGPFDTNNPAPYQGIGTAAGVSVVTFLQPNRDGNDLTPGNNTAWGTQEYPSATVSNKQTGVQFNVSTLGAKNIKVSFDLRATTTASKYLRLQYTTNGTDFIDYPTSQSNAVPSTYTGYAYDLTGFPGVANNPNFGIRMVTEFENTANYGNTNDATYVGVTAGYASTGTISYDLVLITGDAIVGGNKPPTISTITNAAMIDGFGTNVTFTVSDDSTPAGSLAISAVSLLPSYFITATPTNTAGTIHMNLNSALGNTTPINIPMLVTVTDGNGDPTVESFLLTVNENNGPPVFGGLITTNMLTNSTLVIPFTLQDDHTPSSALTVTLASGTSSLIPADGTHLSVTGSSTNRTLTITPVPGQSGAAPITVSSTDGDGLTGTATFVVEVRPDTNVMLIDNFNYDTPGPIINISGGLWNNHSGTHAQLQAGNGVAIIDSAHNTEDVNAPLFGAPYPTNIEDNVTLYASYTLNVTSLPDATGAYITHFKDNTTFGFLGRVFISTTNAAAGDYRVGIGNSTVSSNLTAQLPTDLLPNSNYTVVVRIRMTNGFCTVWVNPTSESSPSVTDTTVVTNLVPIYQYAFRESTPSGGTADVSALKVGTSFTAVTGLPSGSTNAPPSPTIGGITIGGPGGTNVILSGTNNSGTGGGSYVVLQSTNLLLPVSQWTVVSTQMFNADGTFSFTNGMGLDPNKYYIIQALP